MIIVPGKCIEHRLKDPVPGPELLAEFMAAEIISVFVKAITAVHENPDGIRCGDAGFSDQFFQLQMPGDARTARGQVIAGPFQNIHLPAYGPEIGSGKQTANRAADNSRVGHETSILSPGD